jgi:alpha-tubulin suppressor-like RCC1 family protein
VAAGLFHSAAITTAGELITFGCGRFGQCISNCNETSDVVTGRWRPEDGSRLVRVACGRRHTVALDDLGRVWTFGENKYGQLGRSIDHGKFDGMPHLVEGALGKNGSACFDIDCGWSHTVACVRRHDDSSDSVIQIFGWGRNDKGQLGTGSVQQLSAPKPLFGSIENVQSVACGPESTMLIDGAGVINGCGWNEHGNLAIGNDADALHPEQVVGARVIAPPLIRDGGKKLIMAAGGACFLVMRI